MANKTTSSRKSSSGQTSNKKTAASRSNAGARSSHPSARNTSGTRGASGNSTRSSGTSKKRTAQVAQEWKEADQNRKELYDEVFMIITALVCILLYLSYFGLGGIVGKGVNYVVFGTLGGILPYFFPVALFFAVAFIRSNSGNPVAARRTMLIVFALLVVSALIHIISGCATKYTFGQAFSVGAKEHIGGGFCGACLSEPLLYCFGKVATIIILIALLLVCFILISRKAILASIRNAARRDYYEDYAEYEEERQTKKKEASAHSDYHQMHLGELPEQPVKRKLVVVDAIPPTGEVDTSFYVNPEPKKPKKKTTFLDRLKSESKAGDFPKSPVNEAKQAASYEPLQDFEEAERIVPGTDNSSSAYQKELDRKFRTETAASTDSITKNSYDDDDFSGITINNMHNAPSEATTEFSESVQSGFIERPAKKESSTSVIKETAAKDAPVKENAAMADNTPAEPIVIEEQVPEKAYVFPPIDLLSRPKNTSKGVSNAELKETAAKLQNTLRSFGVNVTITNISCGPSVTRYELQPEQGVKVSRITALADDIKLNLAAEDIRIEAPIPGKAAVGIEVPNHENSMVPLRSLLESPEFIESKCKIAFAAGKDIAGQIIVTDITKMPHLLIAGATGSGKSVCINTLIMSILYKYAPKDVRLIMVDPKVVELSVYNGIPHLLIPVVTDPKKASSALNWAVMEMTDRYNKFAEMSVRDLGSYNEKIANSKEELVDNAGIVRKPLPQIVIIVDELADLMMVAPGEVEDAICRLAQLARAAGIHLVIATQRPSVNVITGLIKANVPSRIAFAVSSSIDSRTILDQGGAEKLLGKGDMLFAPRDLPKPIRAQGAFVSDTEVSAVVEFLKEQNSESTYSDDVANHIANGVSSVNDQMNGGASSGSDRDEYFIEAGKFIIEKDKASIGMLQRVYKIGFNRAARIMDQLADAGVVGPEEGTKPRKILMSAEEFEQYVDEYV